jgi:hypothetical protein
VVAWHRAGFRLFWTWEVRRGQPGRPVISLEVRDLIRKICRENPFWGAPRIHGELLKLGINIGESSVSKYMVLSQIDSSGVSIIIEMYVSLKRSGGELKLLAPRGRVLHVLTVFRLLHVIPGFEDEAAAVESFQPRSYFATP